MRPTTVSHLTNTERQKIAQHLSVRFGDNAKKLLPLVPTDIETWGKVRRLDGGDTIHARTLVELRHDSRDASYIRVRLSCCIHLHDLLCCSTLRTLTKSRTVVLGRRSLSRRSSSANSYEFSSSRFKHYLSITSPSSGYCLRRCGLAAGSSPRTQTVFSYRITAALLGPHRLLIWRASSAS